MADKPVNHGRDHRRGGTDPTPTGTAYALIYFNTLSDSSHNQSVGATNELDVQWYGFQTNDLSVFGTALLPTGDPLNAEGDKWLHMLLPGSYMVLASLLWETGTYSRYAYITSENGLPASELVGNGTETLAADDQAASSTSLKAAYPLKLRPVEYLILNTNDDGTFTVGAIKLVAGNGDSGSRNITAGTLACFYQGDNNLGSATGDTVYS